MTTVNQGNVDSVEINTLFGTRTASVFDPFGNILGLTGTTLDAKQRVRGRVILQFYSDIFRCSNNNMW